MINKQEFTEYLKSKHPKSKAGVVDSPDSCPAARFASQNYFNVLIGKDGLVGENKDTNEIEISQPAEWLINFIEGVDSVKSNKKKVVTYGRCLKILEAA